MFHSCHNLVSWLFRLFLIWLVLSNMNFMFPFHIWDNHPNWRTHIFQRGRYTTNQSLLPCCCVINFVAQALPSDHSNPSVRENDMLFVQNKWSEPMHMSAEHIYIYIYIVTPRERQTHIRKQRTTNLNICKKQIIWKKQYWTLPSS